MKVRGRACTRVSGQVRVYDHTYPFIEAPTRNKPYTPDTGAMNFVDIKTDAQSEVHTARSNNLVGQLLHVGRLGLAALRLRVDSVQRVRPHHHHRAVVVILAVYLKLLVVENHPN